jgi:ABC-type Fe3+ transport system permease subunit
VLLDAWYNNNTANEGRRVVLTSIAVPMANLMGVVSSNIFRKEDAPNYLPALITTASFGACGIILTLCLGLWMMADNRRRDRLQGVHIKARDIPSEYLQEGPACDDFRWFY